MAAPAKVGYAPINGLQLYYEVHGTGKPLIVLHGGIAASEALGPNEALDPWFPRCVRGSRGVPLLAKARQVVAVHLQGHGRTKDIDRPLRYETLADDVAALVGHLGFSKVQVMGYSLGGGVAAQVAIRHPHIVERLVIVSEAMKRRGWHPEVLAAFDQMEAAAPQLGANVGQSPLAKLYPHVDWAKLFAKMGKLLAEDYDWSKEVAQIRAPTMLVFADADAQTPEHIMEVWGLLGGGKRDAGYDGSLRPTARLAIVPGTTHYNLLSTPVVAELVAPFLDAALPAAR